MLIARLGKPAGGSACFRSEPRDGRQDVPYSAPPSYVRNKDPVKLDMIGTFEGAAFTWAGEAHRAPEALGSNVVEVHSGHGLFEPGCPYAMDVTKLVQENTCSFAYRFNNNERISVRHLKLLHGAWVFVGDGQKALFLINEGDEIVPNLRRLSVVENPDPPTHEQGSDAPGRAFGSVGQIRSSVEETDWHELQKERFAASIAERINKAAMANVFSQIVIVAPAKILGDLRHEFPKRKAKSSPK